MGAGGSAPTRRAAAGAVFCAVLAGMGFGRVCAAQGLAPAVVLSPKPDAVSVTVYRDPASGGFSRDTPRGFAVISERRRLTLPAGEVELRFEGVANGMLAASAVVEGLPGGVLEQNRDARLLTPASLIGAAVGAEAVLVRTDPATGRARSIPVRILSGADGVVLQSKDGVEALRCSGLPERLVFPQAPAGLSDSPTFSVRARAPAAASVEVTLSYIAQGFDWAMHYVATLEPDADRLTLTAWVTFANANSVSFADAPTQIIAGRVRRSESPPLAPRSRQGFNDPARCWPWDTTATRPQRGLYDRLHPPPPPPPAMMMMAAKAELENIVVTGSRLVREEFGDLKLYRTPEPTSILANAQKQVLLLSEAGLPFERRFEAALGAADGEPRAAEIILEVENARDGPLAQPLPKGQAVVFEVGAAPVLLAQTEVEDLAVGQRLELKAGASRAVRLEHHSLAPKRYAVVVRNTGSTPARVLLRQSLDQVRSSTAKFKRENGEALWSLTIAPGGERRFEYRSS
jgi:hypothetical protein